MLTSLWVLAILGVRAGDFEDSTEGRDIRSGGRRRSASGWPSVLRLATKLTGWFLPAPVPGLGRLGPRPPGVPRARRRPAVAGSLVLLLLNPPWWTEPVAGLARFFRSNLTRGQTIPIPVQFLGTIYQTPNESLPWYNTLAWTVMVTPVGFLLLAVAGMVPGGPPLEDASRSAC